jgi:pheromone shutdown protein TraB
VEVERQQKLKEESQKKLAQQVGKMIMNEFWEKIKMVSEVIREQKEAAEMKKQLDADLDDMVENFSIIPKISKKLQIYKLVKIV